MFHSFDEKDYNCTLRIDYSTFSMKPFITSRLVVNYSTLLVKRFIIVRF
jgi:hypothetical protein